MIIVSKNQFLEWFKHMKGIIGEMDIKINNDDDWMECPNCRTIMENYTLNNDPGELWYLRPKCNLTSSQTTHQYSTSMLMQLNGEFPTV